MAFTAKDVAALREMSGAGMMDCKKALTECNGDMDKAMDFLREKSLAANRAGISKIIFPKGNVRDLDEVPAAVREKMTYVPVENMSQVLKEAMVR